MWRLAASLMDRGFERASQGLKDYRDITTEENSAALMQNIIAAGDDRNAINSAVANANPNYLSPQALNFANNQEGVLLGRQGEALNNQVRSQNLEMKQFEFGRAQQQAAEEDANNALLPEAMSEM